MSTTEAYAHSPPQGASWDRAHRLEDHLRSVSELARVAGAAFGASDLAALSGLWHDLGKYRPAFQSYIRGASGLEKSHKLAGAALALRAQHPWGDIISFAIAGHHGGLPRAFGEAPSLDEMRQHGERELAEAIAAGAPTRFLTQAVPTAWRPSRALGQGDGAVYRELLTRFIFSTLVDADYRDTAAFYDPAAEACRAATIQRHLSMAQLAERLDVHLHALEASAPETVVNLHRRRVLAACRSAADQDPGIFALTVPTGGGKTLAAMAFALRHAARHGKRRVVVVLPFTAIIEQNARVYQDILGADQVLEHHGAADGEAEHLARWCRDQGINLGLHAHRMKLMAENWDAPVVVTTNVQLLESLHANAPSRCRKLHNIANSVVILDESQTIPASLLEPTLDTLRVLVAGFGVTLVSCTATQPALAQRTDALGRTLSGLGVMRPIIPDPAPLFADLDRVTVTWPSDLGTALPWSALADIIRSEPHILVIVHRRQDAYDLARLAGDDCLHLSALMLPDHRRQVLDEVRRRLRIGEPCRVVATQLVEAGVDLDFPVVYRALAGLDALAQAAGRCNREGRLGHRGGRFVVFVAPSAPPRGILASAADTAAGILRGGAVDLADPHTYPRFYGQLYDSVATDGQGLADVRKNRDFPEIARRYRLIDDGGQIPVVVDWSRLPNAIAAAIQRLEEGHADAGDFRLIRRASVQMPKRIAADWLSSRVLHLPPNHPMPILATRDWTSLYDDRFGLCIWDSPALTPEQLVL